jgi:hypothetical protein
MERESYNWDLRKALQIMEKGKIDLDLQAQGRSNAKVEKQ